MNKSFLMGRWTKDVILREGAGEGSTSIARGTLAVDRRRSKDGENQADFISCVAFGKTAEFLEKYGKKGTKMVVEGRIQTGSYEKDGQRIYTTDVVIENCEFAESKVTASEAPKVTSDDGFMSIPEGIDEELPFM